jgi:Fe-S-cluster-containing dehydrogenase component/CRP-like cAMP-binding protein
MPDNQSSIPFPPGRSDTFGADTSDAVVDQLQECPALACLKPGQEAKLKTFRSILRHDTRVRRFQRGEIIIRQGDYGTSAFLILSGNVRVVLNPHLPPSLIGRREVRRKGVFRTIAQLWNGLREPDSYSDARLQRTAGIGTTRAGEDEVRVFLQDIPRVLDQHKTAEMGPGELFGEVAALCRTPRGASVFADSETVEVLELRWQGLRDLKKNVPEFDQMVNRRLRESGVYSYLEALPELFGGLSREQKDQVRNQAEFVEAGDQKWADEFNRAGVASSEREPAIVQEGDYPNGVFIVRSGFVRMSARYGNGRRTLNYLGAGRYFGLQEVVHNWRHRNEPVNFQHSYTAAGYAHLIFIPTPVMEQMVLPLIPKRHLPEPIRPATEGAEQRAPRRHHQAAERLGGELVEFLAENRFFNGTATMVIDLDRCTRCDDCVRACASTHNNNPRFLRHGPSEGPIMIANACMHCADPVCMIGCPTGAIGRTGMGPVTVNTRTCIGCEVCARQCPYEAIRMVHIRTEDGRLRFQENGKPELRATKCDLCVENHGGPACQRACPHGALARLNLNNLEMLADWLRR